MKKSKKDQDSELVITNLKVKLKKLASSERLAWSLFVIAFCMLIASIIVQVAHENNFPKGGHRIKKEEVWNSEKE